MLCVRLDGCRVAKAVSGYGRRGRSCGRGLRTDGSRGHLRERLTAFVAEAVGRSGLRTAARAAAHRRGSRSGLRTDDFGAADAAELRTVRNLCAALRAFDDTLDPLDLLAPLRDLFQRFVYKRDLRGTFCIRVIFMVFIICLADLCVGLRDHFFFRIDNAGQTGDLRKVFRLLRDALSGVRDLFSKLIQKTHDSAPSFL